VPDVSARGVDARSAQRRVEEVPRCARRRARRGRDGRFDPRPWVMSARRPSP